MIARLGSLPSGQSWGALASRLEGGGAAIPAAAIEEWISSPEILTRFLLIFTGIGNIDENGQGWFDRHLLWERYLLNQGFPAGLADALHDVPALCGGRAWTVAASPAADIGPIQAWTARSAQGVLDAARIVLAEVTARGAKLGMKPAETQTGLAFLIDPQETGLSEHPDPAPTDPGRIGEICPSAVNFIAGNSSENTADFFGRVYNRLVRPVDPFSYLNLLSPDAPADRIRQWEHSATASGWSVTLRNETLNQMASAAAGVAFSPAPRLEHKGALYRQIAGVASSPGRASGTIWRPSEGPEPPRKGSVLLVRRWSAELLPYLNDAAALVETAGGRGGPGAFYSRLAGVPAVSEAAAAAALVDGDMATVDGENGIITLENACI